VIDALGNSRPDWEILQDIIKKFGVPLNYRSSEEVFRDIAETVPLYKGMDYANIGESGMGTVPFTDGMK
jgi:predicted molibdopterin-dependent oxidoreductase YjgC